MRVQFIKPRKQTVIDLYTWNTPNGRKASVMLEECGLAYNVHKIDIGKGDAETIVKTTKPGESFKVVDDWLDSPHIQQQYPHFVDYLYSQQREVSI